MLRDNGAPASSVVLELTDRSWGTRSWRVRNPDERVLTRIQRLILDKSGRDPGLLDDAVPLAFRPAPDIERVPDTEKLRVHFRNPQTDLAARITVLLGLAVLVTVPLLLGSAIALRPPWWVYPLLSMPQLLFGIPALMVGVNLDGENEHGVNLDRYGLTVGGTLHRWNDLWAAEVHGQDLWLVHHDGTSIRYPHVLVLDPDDRDWLARRINHAIAEFGGEEGLRREAAIRDAAQELRGSTAQRGTG